jgi:enoyl-CoA hydratase
MSVRRERRRQMSVITLDRPARANAIDADMTEALDAALNDLEDDPGLRVGILAGSATVFCAGTDLRSGSGQPTARGGEYGVVRRRSTKPLIAAVEGAAMGGGFEIVLACDLVVASRAACFGLPEVSRGLIASSGALFRVLQVLPKNIALELLLTGRDMDAEEAAGHGMVNRLVEPGQALEEAQALAELIIAQSPAAIGASLDALRTILAVHDGLGWEATGRALARVIDAPDREEGLRAFLERRVPRWPDP